MNQSMKQAIQQSINASINSPIPFGVERWIAHAVRKRSLDVRGPLARAWAEADRITPILFTIR